MVKATILGKYEDLKKQVKNGLYRPQVTQIISDLYSESLSYLTPISKEQLISKVGGKQYFAFSNERKISRAINSGLYAPDYSNWEKFRSAMASDDLGKFSADEISKLLYTMAISFCACIDLMKDGDQKTTGTFFEYFIAYFFTWRVGVEPKNSIQILNVDSEDTKLPTDFIYNLGPKKPKFHLPVKTSSRERSIMLWAHQKLLDGVYGIERFMGTPVLLAETKTNKAKREVVEICLPEQWRVYQLYIAKLKRIYYLDPPTAYCELNKEFPALTVKPFSEFFSEWSELSPT